MAATLHLPGGCGLGTAPMGTGSGWELDWGRSEPAEALATVRAAAQSGVGWIDTAPFYGWGRAEQLVGDALRGLDARPLLLTKCGTVQLANGRSGEDHGAATIRGGLDASLARLGVQAVDVLQIHDPDPNTPIEDAWSTVCSLVSEGKAMAGGLSNHPVALMDLASGVGPVTVVQHQYSLLHRAPEADGVLEWCTGHDAMFLAWSPLASGFLADGFDVAALDPGDFRRRLPWADPSRLDLAGLRADLGLIARDAGLTMTALAVGWVLAKGARAIIGARSPSEAEAMTGYLPLDASLVAEAEEAVQAAATRARTA